MSTELEEIFGNFDYVNDQDRGAQNLNEWLKFSPNVKALINSVMPEFQELHDAQQDVYSTINIFEAIGTQLDDIFGTLLDLERITSQTDDDYRLDLLSQASIFSRSGEIIIMKSIYGNLIAASQVSLFEYQPAAFKMQATVTTIPSAAELTKIRETLVRAKQGGNNMQLSVTASLTPFRLGEFTSEQTNSTNGFSGSGFTGGTLSEGF